MQKTHTRRGFTLIELLVAVLIIGILAAIALPQYQKAVEKSRGVQALSVIRSIANAQELYFLAHGEEPTSFDELDIDLTAWTGTEKWRMDDENIYQTRSNADWSLQLLRQGISIGRISGDYKGAGFTIKRVKANSNEVLPYVLYCVERTNGVKFKKTYGDYCEKLWHASSIGLQGGTYAYIM